MPLPTRRRVRAHLIGSPFEIYGTVHGWVGGTGKLPLDLDALVLEMRCDEMLQAGDAVQADLLSGLTHYSTKRIDGPHLVEF